MRCHYPVCPCKWRKTLLSAWPLGLCSIIHMSAFLFISIIPDDPNRFTRSDLAFCFPLHILSTVGQISTVLQTGSHATPAFSLQPTPLSTHTRSRPVVLVTRSLLCCEDRNPIVTPSSLVVEMLNDCRNIEIKISHWPQTNDTTHILLTIGDFHSKQRQRFNQCKRPYDEPQTNPFGNDKSARYAFLSFLRQGCLTFGRELADGALL